MLNTQVQLHDFELRDLNPIIVIVQKEKGISVNIVDVVCSQNERLSK